MAYKSRYFVIQELVSKAVYEAIQDRAWLLFDENILRVLDRLREKFGPGYINNWLWGGNAQLRGLRHPRLDYQQLRAQNIYSHASLHNFGKAVDVIFRNASAAEVRAYILSRPNQFPEIKGIEKDVSWLHIDTRNTPKLIIF